jgi:energy-coupling factor transporter ATP-binding protein EcfA2
VYRDLRISNFRRFQHFTMEGLGRVNLLVGPNNCGKTTVLEAIDLLAEQPDPCSLGHLSINRGAVTHPAGEQSLKSARIGLRHLFYGHVAKVGAEFGIAGTATDATHRLRVKITAEPTKIPRLGKLFGTEVWLDVQRSGLEVQIAESVPLTGSAEWMFSDWSARNDAGGVGTPVPFVGTSSLESWVIAELLSKFQLNPEEELVLDILRLIEPRIDGITSVGTPVIDAVVDRGGIYVRLKGQRERIPIGSLGEGVWRLLALALALVDARGSVLLVDEIDIGLHYTAQADMWRMVKRAAEELDVQVFATTHSRDCIYALAQVARADVTDGSEVTIQRIEGDHAVAYNEQEIVLAAERGIEVR